MGCGEDELCATASISKRFKLPRKFLDDSKSVDYASVPRKLRSAMKKRRNRGFNGVELPGRDSIKKSKLHQKRDLESPPRQTVLGSITKDEEEVVETLSALAVMFPLPNSIKDNALGGESGKEKYSPLPEAEISKPEFQDYGAATRVEDSKSLCPSASTAAAVNPSLIAESAQESKQAKCLNELTWPYFTNLPHPELYNANSQRSFQGMPVLSKDEPMDRNIQPGPRLGTGSERAKHEETSTSAAKPEIAVESAAAPSGQYKLEYIVDGSKNHGLTLWPSLCSSGSHGAGTQGTSLQLTAAKSPAWFGHTASRTQLSLLDSGVVTKRDSRPAVARDSSLNRCSAHVYISRLIKILQIAEEKGTSTERSAHITLEEEVKQGLHLSASNLKGLRNGLNESISARSVVHSATGKKPNEANAVIFHKRLLQDQQQASTASSFFTSQKPCIDFLSLSAGRGGVKATNANYKIQNGLEPLAQFNIPYLQSFTQSPTAMPFSISQNRFCSSTSNDHPLGAAAKQFQPQPPPYLSDPSMNPSQLGSTVKPKMQQQWIWAAQLAAYPKSMGFDPSHLPVLQNEKEDLPPAIQYARLFPPSPSPSSLEVLGPRPKYIPFSPQQIVAIPSSSKRQHHLLSSGYGVLCNEKV